MYINGILAFETLRMKYALEQLDKIESSDFGEFMEVLADIDAIEAAYYRQIIQERLAVIATFKEAVNNNQLEKVLQEYIFEHLWLLDPAWERATQEEHMENPMQLVIEEVPQKGRYIRMDIKYRKVSGTHVIIELKRASTRVSKTEIEEQLGKYISSVQHEINKLENERKYPIEAICIVGKLPQGWDNPDIRKRDEESLKPYSIKVLTYDELVNNAYSAYSKYFTAKAEGDKLHKLIEDIKNYNIRNSKNGPI